MSVATEVIYDSKCFDVKNMAQAMSIILTPEDSTTEQRWATETPYLTDLITHHLDLKGRHKVLDLGSGIGRIAKSLIHRTGCSVVGVDTSVSMRSLAPSYVLSNQFMSCPPEMLPSIVRPDFAIAVWALQHIPDLQGAIDMIHKNLVSYGKLFVVNMQGRCLPTSSGGWFNDKKDTRELLCARFDEVGYGALDPEKTTPGTARSAFWGVYSRRS